MSYNDWDRLQAIAEEVRERGITDRPCPGELIALESLILAEECGTVAYEWKRAIVSVRGEYEFLVRKIPTPHYITRIGPLGQLSTQSEPFEGEIVDDEL